MRNLSKALAIGLLGFILVWGFVLAQDNPAKSVPPGGTNRPQGRGNFEMRNIFEQATMMSSPKVQDEVKRHTEAMKTLSDKVKALADKIKQETAPKSDASQGQVGDKSADSPANRDNPNPPANPPVRAEPPAGTSPEDKAKALESYRPDATVIAKEIVAKVTAFHQNLAKILDADKDSILDKVTTAVLTPPRGPMGPGGRPAGAGQNRPPRPPQVPQKPPEEPKNPDDKGAQNTPPPPPPPAPDEK